jgi:serine/threonine-protein kinase RsbW
MASEVPPYVFTMPSDLRFLPCARAFVTAVCQTAGLDHCTTENLALAAHEAINNAIRHAHGHRTEVPLQIRCLLAAHGLEILILDEGEPFDLAALPQLDPAELRIGGRGFFLMRRLTDEVSCQPRSPRGNVIRLVKRWPGESEPTSSSAAT